MRILATLSIVNDYKMGLQVLLGIIGACFLIWLIAAFCEQQPIISRVLSVLFTTAIVIGIFFITIKIPDYEPNKYKYYVEITDKNNESEILKDYILLDTIGNIYIIKDK